MGNRLQKINLAFRDSNWKNSFEIITTNIDSQNAGDGSEIIVNSDRNATDTVGRTARETFEIEDWHNLSFDEVASRASRIELKYSQINNIPACEWILDFLLCVNALLVLLGLILYGKFNNYGL